MQLEESCDSLNLGFIIQPTVGGLNIVRELDLIIYPCPSPQANHQLDNVNNTCGRVFQLEAPHEDRRFMCLFSLLANKTICTIISIR